MKDLKLCWLVNSYLTFQRSFVPSSLGSTKYLPVYTASYSSIWISSHRWEPVFQFYNVHDLYFPLVQVCSVSYSLVYCHCFCPTCRNWFKLKCVMPTHPYYVLHRDRITFPIEKYDMLNKGVLCIIHTVDHNYIYILVHKENNSYMFRSYLWTIFRLSIN